jgi:enamine deaminase RidA (YjgF/YER057c/UK114 family)
MREKCFTWLGQEFVALSCEGDPGARDVTTETTGLFQRFDQQLGERGLSLANTVRTRLWARDMACWADAVKERARVLAGDARSVSSSHIRPSRFASGARVAVDLLAMVPGSGQPKRLVEYEPPGIVLRCLEWEDIVFLSGVTVILPTLSEQLPIVVERIRETLAHAHLDWSHVVKASLFLHREESLDELRRAIGELIPVPLPHADFTTVDTRQGKRVEIEITARR